MNIRLLQLIIFLITTAVSKAQHSSFEQSSFSHFYFVVDSVTYKNLKENKFITDTLFTSEEGSSKTDQGTWSGNYLQGKHDYWEVFRQGSLENVEVGAIGLGHMLHKPGNTSSLQQQWQSLTKDKIEIHAFTKNKGADTMIIELMNYRDSMMEGGPACFFVMYYHPKLLERSGFSKIYLRDTGVDQRTLNEKWYGPAALNRLYNKTEKIYLRLTPHEFERHMIALKAMGYQQTGKYSFKKEIEIVIDIVPKPVHRLKEIAFSLSRPTDKKIFQLSPGIYMMLEGQSGKLVIE